MRGKALLGFLLAAGLVLTAADPAAARAAVEVGDDTLGIGQSVPVTGSGWPPGALVTLEVCGNGAVDGSVDCHQPSAREVGVRRDGTFATLFRVQRPQGMCPCLIRAASASARDVVTVPVTILGVPLGQARSRYTFPSIQRVLEVRRSDLVDAGPWTAWFGAAPRPVLVLEVVNRGDVLLRNPPLTVTWGKGKTATELVPLAAKIGELEPGASRTLRIPVRLESFAFGSYRVEGEIHGLGDPVKFDATTSRYPWGLLVLALVALQLLLVRLRNRLRRHLVPEEVIDLEAYERELVELVAQRIPRRPARTPREFVRPFLAGVGRPVERLLARRRGREATTAAPIAAPVETPPIPVVAPSRAKGNGNGEAHTDGASGGRPRRLVRLR